MSKQLLKSESQVEKKQERPVKFKIEFLKFLEISADWKNKQFCSLVINFPTSIENFRTTTKWEISTFRNSEKALVNYF